MHLQQPPKGKARYRQPAAPPHAGRGVSFAKPPAGGSADVPDGDESFSFNSDDDAFLAAVDLGEGNLGRPIDFEEGERAVDSKEGDGAGGVGLISNESFSEGRARLGLLWGRAIAGEEQQPVQCSSASARRRILQPACLTSSQRTRTTEGTDSVSIYMPPGRPRQRRRRRPPAARPEHCSNMPRLTPPPSPPRTQKKHPCPARRTRPVQAPPPAGRTAPSRSPLCPRPRWAGSTSRGCGASLRLCVLQRLVTRLGVQNPRFLAKPYMLRVGFGG